MDMTQEAKDRLHSLWHQAKMTAEDHELIRGVLNTHDWRPIETMKVDDGERLIWFEYVNHPSQRGYAELWTHGNIALPCTRHGVVLANARFWKPINPPGKGIEDGITD